MYKKKPPRSSCLDSTSWELWMVQVQENPWIISIHVERNWFGYVPCAQYVERSDCRQDVMHCETFPLGKSGKSQDHSLIEFPWSTKVQLVWIPSKMIQRLRNKWCIARRIYLRSADGVNSATSPIVACQNWTFRTLRKNPVRALKKVTRLENQGRFFEYFFRARVVTEVKRNCER